MGTYVPYSQKPHLPQKSERKKHLLKEKTKGFCTHCRTARNQSFSLPIGKDNFSKTFSSRLQQKILQTLNATNPLKLSKSHAFSMVKYLSSNI